MHSKGDISTELFVYNSLKEALYARKLAPGTGLIERSICDAYGVGRTPVRAAFRRLADEGFLEIVPHRGAFVVTTTREQLSMLYDARSELQMAAVRKSMGEYTEKDFHALEEYIQKERNAVQEIDLKQYLDCIEDFFTYIMEKGKNPVLTEMHKMIYNRIRILLVLYDDFYAPVHLIMSCEAHGRIVEMLRRRDVESLECELREHSEEVISKIRFHNIATADVNFALKD